MCTLFSGAGIWYANFHEKQNFVCPWGTLQKEFLNMDLSRRGFIGILGAAAAAPRLFAKAPSDYDPDLTVLLSDIHVNGVERDVVYQREKFAGLVAEILKLNPLPARAVVFGDLAWLYRPLPVRLLGRARRARRDWAATSAATPAVGSPAGRRALVGFSA